MDLSVFFAQNKHETENVKFVASKNFGDGNVEWEIRAIDTDENEAIRKACTKRMPVSGKPGVFTPELDIDLYTGKVAVASTVFPNLNNAELQDTYGVRGAEAVLKKMLTPGEYRRYCDKVAEVNGFLDEFSETVEEAKN